MPNPRGPWHPCDDGIEPIREALQRFVKMPTTGLRDRLEYFSKWPQRGLADAKECDARLQGILNSARTWIQRVRRSPAVRDVECGLSQADCEAFDEVCDQAAYAADYLDQLARMLRGKLAAGDAAGRETRTEPRDLVPLTWLRSVVPKRRVRGTAWHLGQWIKRKVGADSVVKLPDRKLYCERSVARGLFGAQAEFIDGYDRPQ